MAGPTERDGGLDIAEAGDGPALLLLHSLLADRSVFYRVVPRLAERRRVLSVNLPGFGRSPPLDGGIEAAADRVAAYLAAAGLGGDTAVLGNGYGGFVAIALAQRHGHRFGRLVLADTGAAFPPAGRQAFPAMAAAAEAKGMAAVVDAALARMFPPTFLARRSDIAAERRASLLAMHPGNFAAACLALAAVDLRPGLASIRNPTLVLVGSEDAATPPALSRELAAAIPGARFVELPGIGHAPHVQDPDSFLAQVVPFLDGA